MRVRNEVPELRVGLYAIRQQIEEGFEVTGAVDDEVRGVAARNSQLASLACQAATGQISLTPNSLPIPAGTRSRLLPYQ